MDGQTSNPTRWRGSVKVIHWLMAALIVTMIGLGWLMTTWKPNIQTTFTLFQLHKSLGVTVFVFLVLRIILRLRYRAPALPSEIPAHERILAAIVQALLYILMLAMPVSGYLVGTFSGFPTKPFGLFTLPSLVAQNKEWYETMRNAHETLSLILVAALLLHIAGALKHHFWDRNDILTRMLPERRPDR